MAEFLAKGPRGCKLLQSKFVEGQKENYSSVVGMQQCIPIGLLDTADHPISGEKKLRRSWPLK